MHMYVAMQAEAAPGYRRLAEGLRGLARGRPADDRPGDGAAAFEYTLRLVDRASPGSVETIILLLGAHAATYTSFLRLLSADIEGTAGAFVPSRFNIPEAALASHPPRAVAGRYIHDTATSTRAGTYEQCLVNIEAALCVANTIESGGSGEAGDAAARLPPGRVHVCVTPHEFNGAGPAFASDGAHMNHLAVLALRLKTTGNTVRAVCFGAPAARGTAAVLLNRGVPFVSVHRDEFPLLYDDGGRHVKESGGAPLLVAVPRGGDVELSRAVLSACDYFKAGMAASVAGAGTGAGAGTAASAAAGACARSVLLVGMPRDLRRVFACTGSLAAQGKALLHASKCTHLVVVVAAGAVDVPVDATAVSAWTPAERQREFGDVEDLIDGFVRLQ